MNPMQRYSRELIAAGSGTTRPRDTSLVWRGQVVEHVAVPGDDTEDTREHAASWLDHAVTED